MSRPTVISYPLVSKCCLQFIAEGETPGIKKIQQRLGGSFSTIGKFYQQWQREQALAAKAESEFSEPFRQAVLAEFTRVTEKTKEGLEAQLKEVQAQCQEAQALADEIEVNKAALEQAFADYKEASEGAKLKLERALSATQARLEESSKREADAAAKVEGLMQQCHASELRTAGAEAKLMEIEKYNHKLESELQALKKGLESTK